MALQKEIRLVTERIIWVKILAITHPDGTGVVDDEARANEAPKSYCYPEDSGDQLQPR